MASEDDYTRAAREWLDDPRRMLSSFDSVDVDSLATLLRDREAGALEAAADAFETDARDVAAASEGVDTRTITLTMAVRWLRARAAARRRGDGG